MLLHASYLDLISAAFAQGICRWLLVGFPHISVYHPLDAHAEIEYLVIVHVVIQSLLF